MAARAPLSRITSATTAYGSAADALAQLDAARQLREAADELEAAAIRNARKQGVTWAAVGSLYGLTKQGAQQRFRPAEQGGATPTEAPRSARKKPAGKPAARKGEPAPPARRR